MSLFKTVEASLMVNAGSAATASGVVAALKAAIAAENVTGVFVVAITAPDRLTVALLVVLMVGEALAVVVVAATPVDPDKGVGAT